MKYEGELADLDLIGKLVELWSEKFTGALRFEREGIIKILYFKEGNVLSASTNDRTDSIDEILLRSNKTTRDHINQALARRKETETIGDALLGLGYVTRKELTWARRIQLIGIIRSLLSWSGGNYTLVGDYLPKREEGTLFYVPQIILELIVTDPDRSRIADALSGGTSVLRKTARFDVEYSLLGLNEDADRVTGAVDGVRSAAEIAETVSGDSFNAYKLLYALELLGLLEGSNIPVSKTVEVSRDDRHFGFPEEPAMTEPAAGDLEASSTREWQLPDESVSTAEEEFLTESDTDARGGEPLFLRPTRRSSGPGKVIALVILIAAAITAGIWGGLRLRNNARLAVAKAPVEKRGAALLLPPIGTRPAGEAKITTTSAVAPPTVVVPAPTAVAPPPTAQVVTPNVVPTSTRSVPVPVPSVEKQPASVTPPATQRPLPASSTTTPPRSSEVATSTSPAPAPAAGSAADPLRREYETQAREWAGHLKRGEYAVQFELVCETSSLQKALAAGGDNVWFLPVQFHGKSCFRVLWGHYSAKETAGDAIDQIPPALRQGSSPVVIDPQQLVGR